MRLARGTSAPFEAQFVDLDGEPLVSADPNVPVTVEIKDPDGQGVASGVGKPIGGGTYRFDWFVPEDAEINTPERKWSVNWYLITTEGHNRSAQEFFDVVDKVQAGASDREWTLLTRAGTQERVSIQRETRPTEIGLDILFYASSLIKDIFGKEPEITEAKLDSKDLEPSNPDRKIGRTVNDGVYNYFYDTDPLNTPGEYVIFWKIRDSPVSAIEHIQRNIRVPENTFWLLNKPLRMLIDRLQKKAGLVQSYSTSDIYEYIRQGLGYVNMTYPQTHWTLDIIPAGRSDGVETAVLLGAAIYALNAQQILETELSFSFGGQTVTLDYNHDFGGVISNMGELFNRFVESKKHLYRQACGVGRVGVRPKNYNYTQRVWRVGNFGGTSPYDVNVLLSQIGLF